MHHEINRITIFLSLHIHGFQCVYNEVHTHAPQHKYTIVFINLMSKIHFHIAAVTKPQLVFMISLHTLSSSTIINHWHCISYFIMLSSRNTFLSSVLVFGRWVGWGCKQSVGWRWQKQIFFAIFYSYGDVEAASVVFSR